MFIQLQFMRLFSIFIIKIKWLFPRYCSHISYSHDYDILYYYYPPSQKKKIKKSIILYCLLFLMSCKIKPHKENSLFIIICNINVTLINIIILVNYNATKPIFFFYFICCNKAYEFC